MHKCATVHLYGFNVAKEGVKTHDFKAWYYTDTLWHRPDLDKHKPSDAAMFQHKKWKVDKWTYADNNGFKGRRRRLLRTSLKGHQSETIMVEKNCLKELYASGLIDATED
mmetsp:Transcript_18180/g.30561  ORF Transcript_18180/g.30561 Transcript_18180/m.30561 type:complete len:110 (-) Transcript_18180:105-434(-)